MSDSPTLIIHSPAGIVAQAASVRKASKRLKALGEEIESLELRWLELSEAIEQLGA